MDDIHFDAVLKNALTDDLLDEYAETILGAEKRNISFSRKYLERRKRMLKNPRYSHKNLNGYAKVINIIAFVALILLMAMAAGATLLP
jgi:hypothetical protein